MNILLFVVKYTAAVLSGVYGVYATLTDFREEKNGKKVLSKKGYGGILLLAVSTVLGLSSDGLKDYRERREADRQETKREEMIVTQKNIRDSVSKELDKSLDISRHLDSALESLHKTSEAVKQNAETSSKALHEARRATAPFSLSSLSGTVEVSLSLDDEFVQSYLKRIHPLELQNPYSHSYRPEDVGFPQPDIVEEYLLNGFVTQLYIEVAILKNPREVLSDETRGDLVMIVVCHDLDGKHSYSTLTPEFNQGKPFDLVVKCQTDNVQVVRDSGDVRSFVDFLGAAAYVVVYDDEVWPDDKPPNTNPRSIVLTTSDGRSIELSNLRKAPCTESRACFTRTISEGSLWSHRYARIR
jgi:hypothetical protein